MRIKTKLVSIILILLPAMSFAEGQAGFEYITWTIDFIFVFALWTGGAVLLLLCVQHIRHKQFTKKQRFIFWAAVLSGAFFHWSMITYDPHPTEGPIDYFTSRRHYEQKALADSAQLIYGRPDSAIDETIVSVDSNAIGVYIWLNHKRIFVRKLTPGLYQRQQDSLTMYIVRSWKNK